MNIREFVHSAARLGAVPLDDGPQPEFRINLTVAVHDQEALWMAAAARALAEPGIDMADVVDMIGPREAPQTDDCIAMMIGPPSLPGCRFDDFWVDSLPGLPSRGALLTAVREKN